MWQSLEILSFSILLTLKQTFWKTKIFFKLKAIENASFPYGTAISEANVKADKMVNTKWTYRKERSFASNYFIVLEILFLFKNLFDVPTTQMPIFVLFVSARVLLDGGFSLWLSLIDMIS